MLRLRLPDRRTDDPSFPVRTCPNNWTSQARPASIIATFGRTTLIEKRGSGSGALTATTLKRAPWISTKPSRQRGDHLGFGQHRKRENEIWHGQGHAPRQAFFREFNIHESGNITGMRNDEMLHLAVALEGRVALERMPLSNGDDELFLVELLFMETDRNIVEGNDRDIHRPVFELLQRILPRQDEER